MDEKSALGQVVRGGDERASLVALRNKIADEIDLAEYPRDVASLSIRLAETLRRITEIDEESADPEKPRTALDELIARRKQAG